MERMLKEQTMQASFVLTLRNATGEGGIEGPRAIVASESSNITDNLKNSRQALRREGDVGVGCPGCRECHKLLSIAGSVKIERRNTRIRAAKVGIAIGAML